MGTLTTGSRLGPYELVARIGAGGMGEVWRATDTRLGRSVAVKVLASTFEDSQQQARFQREAKSISQLNHPNICTLHDVGSDNGVSYLVMELIEGESLADRLSRGPLPLPDVMRYGAQIADALDRAHKSGIVHRDLKPGNVMLTKTGAKLVDFGLAKGRPPLAGFHDETIERDAGLESRPLTAEGTILGTFQYMAPEQLEGAEVDARTDIFALGAVLYEMATGRRAFQGRTKTSLIASIVAGDPAPVRSLQPLAPVALEHVIATALQKDPADRWQSAHDVAEELRWIGTAESQAGTATIAARRSERVISVAAFLFALAAAGAFVAYERANGRAQRLMTADVLPPHGTRFDIVGDQSGPPVLSPDGQYIAFSAADENGTRLWIRSVASGDVKPLSGTDGATFPFWSPDSRNIAFFAAKLLRRIDINGGAPTNIAPAIAARGGAWSKQGVIVFSSSTLTPLSRVSADGGAVTQLTSLDASQHTTHRWPSFMPDGRHLVFLAANHQDQSGGANAVYMASLDRPGQRLILNNGANAIYADGYLLFVRGAVLYAQKMSDGGTLSGEPAPLIEGVLNDGGIWRGGFSVSATGDLVYCTGQMELKSRLAWLDRTGKLIAEAAPPDVYRDVQLSPDQKKIVVSVGDPFRDLWVLDLARNTRTKLEIPGRWVGTPVWTPDSSTVLANVISSGSLIMAKRLDGSAARDLTDSKPAVGGGMGMAVTPDGKTLFYASHNALWTAPTDRSRPRVQLTSETMYANDPRLSADGRWLAYTATENGRSEIFVALARDVRQRWQVSDAGGTQPLWRSDGKELYYIDLQNHLHGVAITSHGDSLETAKPQMLFSVHGRPLSHVYDVSADGQRFIAIVPPENSDVTTRLVTSWKKLLRSESAR